MVAEFIQNNIQSVWQLELLLHLKACDSPQTPAELAHAMYMSPEVIAGGLSHFEKCGLVEECPGQSNSYRYAPANGDLGEAVEQTAKSYAYKRVAIVNMIFSRTMQHNTPD